MAGHGRRIPASEEQGRSSRSVLPISLTGRLHSNTWRQVFTSLRPFVAQTRQRTLSTYARRLHQRQLDGQTQNPVLENVPLLSEQAGDSSSWQQQQHSHHPTGVHIDDGNGQQGNTDSGQNVVIDIETNTRGTILPANSSNIPVHQDTENDSAFTSVNNTSHSPLAPANDDSTTVASADPLIPREREVPSTSLSESDNANYSDTSSDDGASSGNSNNRSASDSLSDLLNQFPEVRSVLVVAWHYCIFFLIILAKAVFDHFTGLLVLLTLVIGFLWSNNILKKSIARQGRRSVKPLLALLVNIPAGIFFLCYTYKDDKVINTVLLIHRERDGFGVLDLLWIVIVSDYIMKLVTVLLKTCVTILPHSLMHYQNRGKYFLVIEMVSQLYRSLIPIQPWLSYLLGYTGAKVLIGVILTATYLVCKGPDVVVRMKSLHDAVDKFIHNVSYRSTPTKAQLQDAGLCPICHDDFQLPTMLQCKHIFCEQCVVTWLDHEQTCPMCRTQVVDDPAWRDGGTSHFLQLY